MSDRARLRLAVVMLAIGAVMTITSAAILIGATP